MIETMLMVFAIGGLAMLSPGPDFFLIVKNAVRYQRSAALMTAAGVTVAIVVHMSYCVLGIAVVIAKSPWLFQMMKFAGAAYLVYIGIQALRSKGGSINADGTPSSGVDQITLSRAFMQGLLCNLLNPKATLFFLSVFTVMIDVNTSTFAKTVYAAELTLMAAVYWPALVYLIQHPRVSNFLQRSGQQIDRLLGGVLVALGIKVALS